MTDQKTQRDRAKLSARFGDGEEDSGETNVPPAAPQSEQVSHEAAPDMFDMADAPLDGKRIRLFGEDGETVTAYWRHTREFANGSWQPVSFWAHHIGAHRLSIEPVGWDYEADHAVA